MVNRRQLLMAGAAAGGAAVLLSPPGSSAVSLPLERPLLTPNVIEKYRTELLVPAVMPPAHRHGRDRGDEYLIGMRQFAQQILPPDLPRTTVWGFGTATRRGTFQFPGFTIEARVDRPVQVTWINQLVDRHDRFLPPLLPVDPTLLWANPPGGIAGRDSTPTFTRTPGPYLGPVPVVVHLHGGHTQAESDGYPEAWYLPAAKNIPAGYATVGSFYDRYRASFAEQFGIQWRPGTATYRYENDQRAATLWYHDHALGMTRQAIYSGLAGFYLIRGGEFDLPPGVLPGPAPALGDPPGTRYYEIPIVIQDRSFERDGSLFYPSSRAFSGTCTNPADYIPNGDVPPIWVPEFFADTMVANGRTWPRLEVEQRRYRLRLLNGCNTRTLILTIAANPTAERPVDPALPIWLIGTDGGFLPQPQPLDRIVLGTSQRVDIILDFTDVPTGTDLYLINEGPDGPFLGGVPGVDFAPADVNTTGQVMKLAVVPRTGPDTSVPPDQLRLPEFIPLGPATNTRRLSLDERRSTTSCGVNGIFLGIVDPDGTAVPLNWNDPVTENVALNATEIWELDNRTDHAHPIHVHQVEFQIIGRGPEGNKPPTRQQLGYHDTVLALPGEITRIKSFFDLPGRYIWHCHILEHEDHEMMRPINIGPATDPTHAATTTTPTSESRHPSDSPDHRHDQR
ncbi:multicopper oxidase family protein [Salinispora arenicola]|uniref:multicopper oxidase family protein n=1 Tax=Salinispora arenicola TaxID=168697 RepID=UPI00035F5370|nr:multicopper oxidase domain-containing protein [Salinispora arenicola]